MNGSEDAGVVNRRPFPYAAGMDSAADRPRNTRSEHPRPATGRLLPPEPQELQDWREALNHPAMLVALRLARVVVRGVALFAVSFVEIMAELLAPIVLIAGIGWSLLPGLLSMAGTEGQAHELLNNVVQSVPRELHIGHLLLTPATLIVDGLLLIAVVALCRTVQTIINTEI
jgi:hypothetical protein